MARKSRPPFITTDACEERLAAARLQCNRMRAAREGTKLVCDLTDEEVAAIVAAKAARKAEGRG